jgi:magnesium transporter
MKPKKRDRRLRRALLRRPPPGTSPGTLVPDPEAPKSVINVMAYGPDVLVERPLTSTREVLEFCHNFPVVWINVDGLGDAQVVADIGAAFGLHRLALEDVLNVHQRAKLESYGDHRFLVARMATRSTQFDTEQLSLFLGRDFVITFQEEAGDNFGLVRDRIRNAKGLLRTSGPDYLAYALLDAVIDEYFPRLEKLGERLEDLEDDLVLDPQQNLLAEVQDVRRDLLILRRAIWPLREAINALLRDGDPLFKRETRPYLADCYDHTVQIMDLVETYREVGSGLMDIYLSSMSHRMNEVMKVLTIISTIFIPLTFIAGVYGMNFDTSQSKWSMPELRTPYGYVITLGVMLAIAVSLVIFFRRRGWIGTSKRGKA